MDVFMSERKREREESHELPSKNSKKMTVLGTVGLLLVTGHIVARHCLQTRGAALRGRNARAGKIARPRICVFIRALDFLNISAKHLVSH